MQNNFSRGLTLLNCCDSLTILQVFTPRGNVKHILFQQDNITLFCLSASYEPMNFEEAAQKKRRRNPTDEEVQFI